MKANVKVFMNYTLKTLQLYLLLKTLQLYLLLKTLQLYLPTTTTPSKVLNNLFNFLLYNHIRYNLDVRFLYI